MDNSTHSVNEGLIRAILAATHDERTASTVHSRCHFIYCPLSPVVLDDGKLICRATADLSNETLLEAHSSLLIATYIHLYVYPLFILIGILGNALSCLIMLINVRRTGGYPASLYLTLLAFVDGLFLVVSALPDWIAHLRHQLDIKMVSDFSCRFVYWFGHFTTHLSAGLVVGVTVERFIAVQYPLIAHKINTVARTRIALLILILFFCALDSRVLFLVKHFNESVYIVRACKDDPSVSYERQDMRRCDFTANHHGQTWVYVDFAVYALIPFLMIVTLNSLIIRRLLDAQRFRQHMFRFNNYTSRADHQALKHQNFSDSHQAIATLGKYPRCSRRIQSCAETKPLAMMLRPKPSTFRLCSFSPLLSLFSDHVYTYPVGHFDERRTRYSTKQSSISTEFSTLSFEMKARAHHQYEGTSVRHQKSLTTSNSSNTRLTILLLFVSCSFLVLTLPAVVLNLIMSKKLKSGSLIPPLSQHYSSISESIQSADTTLYYTLTRLLMIVNHSINFILYCVLGKRFRRDLKQLFVSCWRKLSRSRRRD